MFINFANKWQRKSLDNLFEKYIEKQTENNYENYDTTLFIGRILNGKRINIEENINLKIKYVSLNKENDTKNDEYKISINRKVNDHHARKYDATTKNDNKLIPPIYITHSYTFAKNKWSRKKY